jgi:hypothetical protein
LELAEITKAVNSILEKTGSFAFAINQQLENINEIILYILSLIVEKSLLEFLLFTALLGSCHLFQCW